MADLPKGRDYINRVTSFDGKLIVANQFDLYIADVRSGYNNWTVRNTFLEDGIQLHTVFTAGSHLFITYYHSYRPDKKQGIARYNPATNLWQHVCCLPSFRQLHHYGVVGSEVCAYIVGGGGEGFTGVRDTVLVYDLHSGQHLGQGMLKHKKMNCSSLIIGTQLYAVGGWNGENNCNSVEVMSLSNYASEFAMFTPFFGSSAAIASDKIVVTGGKFGRLTSNTASVLDISGGFCLPIEPKMKHGRFLHGMCTDGDGVTVVVGGHSSSDTPISDLSSVEAVRLPP